MTVLYINIYIYIFVLYFSSVDVFVCVMKQDIGILLYSTVAFLLKVDYNLKSSW